MFNNVQINRMTLKVDYTRSFKEERSQNESTGIEWLTQVEITGRQMQ